MTGIMEGVVERGTAKAAQIPGYTIAGKTGTAAKLVNGHYSTSPTTTRRSSAFVPSRNPAVAIIVVIDSPHVKGYTGGVVSAPVFKRIAEATLQLSRRSARRSIPLPPVLVARGNESAEHATGVAGRRRQPIVSLVVDGPPRRRCPICAV